MTTSVILSMSSSDSVEVSRAMFEQRTAFQWPWVQKDPNSGTKRYYGRCPDCKNAVQLISIDKLAPAITPHGRHWLKQVDGFPYCLDEIMSCDRFDGHARGAADQELRELTPEADALQRAIPQHFDLMVALLREDTNLILGPEAAGEILAAFLKDGRSRWPTLNTGNIAWLFAYCGATFPLKGKKLIAGKDLAQAIVQNVPAAQISESGYLYAKRGQEIHLTFGLRFHRIQPDGAGATQSIQFYVSDLSHYFNDPKDHNIIFEKIIPLRLNALERRISRRAQGLERPLSEYAQMLNKIAREVLDKQLKLEGRDP